MLNRSFDTLRKKLADQRGDTMVEALAAILIALLGATMLATMVTASVNVSATSQRTLDASYAAETNLFSQQGRLTAVTVSIPADSAEASSKEAAPAVTLYRSNGYEYYLEGKRA